MKDKSIEYEGLGDVELPPEEATEYERQIKQVESDPPHRRVLRNDYLQARGEAFESHDHMDPLLEIELSPNRRPRLPQEVSAHLRLILWLAFMAGSDWERRHLGPRYVDEE